MSEASPTSSKSVTETVNGSHRLVIEGYSLAKGMGIGKHIASENFTVGGYQWAIYFYHDGKNPEDNSTYVSVFIALASEGTDVRALFELTLVDQSGKGKHKVHSHFDRSLESGPYALKYRGSMWYSKMPPKTSKRPTSRGPMDQLRQSVAQRSAAIASRGASDHEVAPPPLELQLITGQVPSTQHSSATSTSTTGRSFPRSIRCKSGNTSTSTSTSTHTRGIVVGKKTREEVRKHGKIKLEWSDELKLPSSQVVQARLTRDIGSVVRDKVPMVAHSYWDLPREHLQIVYNHISTYYDFSYENIALFEYIQKMASLRFNDWMSKCKAHFNTYGTDVPVEFVERVDEWTWLMAHWSTEEAKEREQEAEEMRRFKAEQERANEEQRRKMEDMEARLRLLFGGSASGGESTSRQQP
ncbi:hypothetical protein LguiB_031765 [Lonicera macranthoides]